MTFGLRDYQEQGRRDIREAIKSGARSVLYQLPTGGGKTALTAHMAGESSRRASWRVWFLVHRKELIDQSIRTFNDVSIPHGVIAAGYQPDRRPLVQIGSVQTIGRRLDRLDPPDLIIWDEAHHIAAGTWSEIYQAFPNALHIGLSATPERLDGAGLGRWFGALICGPTTGELIAEGWLAPYRLYAPNHVDLSGVHTKLGDFAKGEIAAKMDKPTITGDAIEHYRRLCPGRRAIVFCCSIEHSQHVVAQFLDAGIAAEHVDGTTDPARRKLAMQKFAAGETLVLSNVELFGEGVDVPAIEAAILLRPTQSLALYLQQVGRALRPAPGKDHAVILDHAGNSYLHGLPDDPRAWSLASRPRKRGAPLAVPVRQCPRCYATLPASLAICKYCRCVLHDIAGGGREVEQVAGQLVEVDPVVLRRQRVREQARADSLEDLIALGQSRGYKNPGAWAKYVYNARQQKRGAAA